MSIRVPVSLKLTVPLILLGFSLWLGLATPPVLQNAWTAAVQALYPVP